MVAVAARRVVLAEVLLVVVALLRQPLRVAELPVEAAPAALLLQSTR